MKNIISVKEGEYKELVSVELSAEQKAIIHPKSTAAKEEKQTVYTYITDNNTIDVSSEDAAKVNELYNNLKSSIATEGYEFISLDVLLNGSTHRGILNYRVNDEHKQIRF